MTTIGIIGSGNIGQSVARQAIAHGYDVVLSNSRGPDSLADVVSALGPNARAATAAEAAAAADFAVIAVPLRAIDAIPVEPLAGKVVLDANNYYPQRDGKIAELDDESTTTSELLQRHLPTSRVVKAFNHIPAAAIIDHATPAGTPGRRALAIAGDDASAREQVAAFVDELGFDVVDLGPLAEGWRIQRDTPGYVKPFTADELRDRLAEAKRYRDQ
jgi:predicted dinucleotide-binding enzyme